MCDYEPPKEKSSTDWSGTLIAVMLWPVLLFFFYIDKADLGFTTCIVLGVSMYAVRLRWGLRKHGWFWATIVLVVALQVPLIFVGRWPRSSVPTLVYSMPIGTAEFLLIMGAINLAQKVFSTDSSSDVGGE